MFNIRVVSPAIIDIGRQVRSHKIYDISRGQYSRCSMFIQ
jgi:hypothetical protein